MDEALLRTLATEQSRQRLGLAAAGAAFWLAIATLPLLVAVVSVYGLVTSRAQVANDLTALLRTGPDTLAAIVGQQLRAVARSDRTTLSVGLVISTFLALWSASAAVYNLDRAIAGAYGLAPVPYLRARGRAFLGAVVAMIGVGTVATVTAGIEQTLEHVSKVLEAVVGIPVLVIVLTAILGLLYRFSVWDRHRHRQVRTGAFGAALSLAVLVAGFDVYVRLAGPSTAIYGALAGVVLTMLFAYLATYVVLLGALLNATLERRPDDLEARAAPPSAKMWARGRTP